MKYLVMYTGHVTGSFAGRDDGYPETKYNVVDEQRLPEFEGKMDLKVFSLAEINPYPLIQKAKAAKARAKEAEEKVKEGALRKLSPYERQLLGVYKNGNF